MEYLEDEKYFDEDALPDVVPFDAGENSYGDEGNEYILEGGDKSNNYSSPPLHVEITLYQIQKMNANQIKDNLREKNSIWYKTILDEII